MKYIYYILSILFTLSFGSCKDDIPGSDNPNIGGITLTLTSGNMETRTNLTSTAATQNVETVYIALYKGNDDKATFVDAQDFGWSKIETTNPYIKQNTFTFDNLVAGAEYILLAVGLDTESKETYGFNDINSFESKLKGKTLANAKAIAANAASIATSELFAGWNTFTYEPDIENKVEVEMKRRVAGVLCYLKDIPSTITTSDGTYTVTKVQLRLFTNQNSAIRLARKEKGENNIGLQEDFGDKPLEGSDILMSYNLKGLPSKDGFYKIPVTDNTRLQNTILMGAYMLPIKYSSAENKSTLTLEVLGKKQSDTGDTTEEEETKLQSFPVLQNGLSSGNDAEKYSIYPNYIYHIGQKPDNNSIEGDYPESLAGEKITVTAKEWDNEEVNVEFPSVPVNATMELVNEDGMAYNTDRYIFDCIGIDDVDGYGYTAESPSYPLYYPTPERLILRISPSLLKSKWRVTIYKCDEDGNIGSNPSGGEMLYINKNNSYEQEYEATPEECEDGTSLTLLLTDYADGNYSSQKKRYSKILLETLDKDRNTVATDDMVIAQYNAITVNYEDRIDLDENEKEIICKAAQGLTLQEAENAFIRAIVSNGKLTIDELSIILDEKCQVIKKTGVLEYIKSDLNIDDVGGLENMKNWLKKRNNSWMGKAQKDYNLPAPKGILITGVPGCGKSLTAKAVSALWNLPLLRLDVGRIFSGIIGSSEENMRKAIKTAQAVAPSILWVDEIEKGFGSSRGELDGGTSSRVFGRSTFKSSDERGTRA